MSSEAATKGAPLPGLLRWLFLLFGGSALLLLAANQRPGADQVVLSRSAYDELLQAVQRAPLQRVRAQGPSVERTECDIERISLDVEQRLQPKAQEIRARLKNKRYPSFEELYQLVVNKAYDPNRNVWDTFPNAYNLTPNFHFPFSNLQDHHVEKAFQLLGRAPAFVVEVGSFHGHSAVRMARILDEQGHAEVPLLCIDPWTGDLGMLLFRDDWDKKITPGELADGRSTSYWQFMLNVRSRIRAGEIGAKHIIPLATTSIVGVRYLTALGLAPDVVYLDSAHEKGETFMELTLYFHTLAPGGVIFGDDFTWDSVSHDVKRFAAQRGLQLTQDGVTWMLRKSP